MRYCLTGEQDLLTNRGEIATQHDGIKANPLIVKYLREDLKLELVIIKNIKKPWCLLKKMVIQNLLS